MSPCIVIIIYTCFSCQRQATSCRQAAVKGCHDPTPCWTRQIQAVPNQPWARCSVFVPPPASRGHVCCCTNFLPNLLTIVSHVQFQAVKDAEPLTRPVAYSGMTNLRRLYEDIPMPGRLAVVGDSLAGFNPASVISLPWNVLIVHVLTLSAKGAPGDKLDRASA